MREFLARVPLPICGLMLGSASLGNLLKTADLNVGWLVFQGLAILLWLLVTAKLILAPQSVLGALKDPVVTSVAPNYTMATMLICGFMLAVGVPKAQVTWAWWLAVVLHFAIMGYFIWQHLLRPKKQLAMVMPSWFVLFVGIGVIAMTAPQFAPWLGWPVLVLSLVLYAGVFPVVMVRLARLPLAQPALPLTTIVAAPASLCLAALLGVVAHPQFFWATALMVFAQLLLLGTLATVWRYVRLPFAPSIGAFTFPLAISAVALTRYNAAFHWGQAVLMPLQWLEWGLTFGVVVWVAGRYGRFLVTLFRENALSAVTAKED